MGDITKNFSYSEFACKGELSGMRCCGGSHPISLELVKGVLQPARDALSRLNNLDVPFHIDSGFRCKRHNMHVKDAAPDSQHTYGRAADVRLATWCDLDELVRIFEDILAGAGGIRRYSTFVHVDVRPLKPHRWDYRDA